jgi:hypothetical protein
MGIEKEGAVTQSPINSDCESGERRASSPGEVGNVPEDNRETDFFTRNGLNLRSFGRRKSLDGHGIKAPANIIL